MDVLIWTEFFVSLIFNPFWAGLLFGLYLGLKIQKSKVSTLPKRWLAPENLELPKFQDLGEPFKGKIIRK